MMEQQMFEIPFTQTDAIPQLPVESELFIIADHLSDEQQIREFAEAMIGQGIRDFNFTGKFGQLWDNIFDEVDIEINPDSTEDTVALTMYWEDKDEFDETMEVSMQPNIYVVYA